MVSQREQLEDIRNYADTLEELKFNSKPHISTLTELARDYGKNRQAKDVIKIIVDRILLKETPIAHKMPTLYLLDSILKNHPDNYKDLIEKILVQAFECVFNHGDEKIRASMHKLRMTWTPWFYWTTLNELDKRINKIDKAWPIIAKKDQVQVRNPTPPVQQPPPTAGLAERKKFRENLSKPNVENGQVKPAKVADTKPPTTTPSGRTNIHVNPNFLENRQLSVSEDSQTDLEDDPEIKAMEEKIQRIREAKAEKAKRDAEELKKKQKKAEEEKKRQRKKELAAMLAKEMQELEEGIGKDINETEVPKITTSGLKSTSSKDSLKDSSSSSSPSTSSSSKASNAKVCFMVKAC